MEIILKEDVIGLGYKNDIVNVKSGCGRNYLIPYGKAVKLAKVKAEAEALAQKLGALHLTITTKVSATGIIYGSVNNLQIAEELQKLGFEINRKTIIVKDVKTVGEYVAVVKLHKEVSAEVPFTVLAEGETAAPAAEEATEAPAEAAAETPAEA